MGSSCGHPTVCNDASDVAKIKERINSPIDMRKTSIRRRAPHCAVWAALHAFHPSSGIDGTSSGGFAASSGAVASASDQHHEGQKHDHVVPNWIHRSRLLSNTVG